MALLCYFLANIEIEAQIPSNREKNYVFSIPKITYNRTFLKLVTTTN